MVLSQTADSLSLIPNIWSSLLNSLVMDPPSPPATLGNILQPVSQVEDDKETYQNNFTNIHPILLELILSFAGLYITVAKDFQKTFRHM